MDNEQAEKMTEQTEESLALLEELRSKAIGKSIPIVPYAVAVFLEYLDLRDQAVETYGEDAIKGIFKEFEIAFRTGKIGSKLSKFIGGNPMYA
jgi:hypothetical protein